jgi:hypothetical protein
MVACERVAVSTANPAATFIAWHPMNSVAWVLGIAAGSLAIGGVAYAATGGASKPATPTPTGLPTIAPNPTNLPTGPTYPTTLPAGPYTYLGIGAALRAGETYLVSLPGTPGTTALQALQQANFIADKLTLVGAWDPGKTPTGWPSGDPFPTGAHFAVTTTLAIPPGLAAVWTTGGMTDAAATTATTTSTSTCTGATLTPGVLTPITLSVSQCTAAGCPGQTYCPPSSGTVTGVMGSASDTSTLSLSSTLQFAGIKIDGTSKPGTATISIMWTDASGAAQTSTVAVTVTA